MLIICAQDRHGLSDEMYTMRRGLGYGLLFLLDGRLVFADVNCNHI
jgi:hypothetical protein